MNIIGKDDHYKTFHDKRSPDNLLGGRSSASGVSNATALRLSKCIYAPKPVKGADHYSNAGFFSNVIQGIFEDDFSEDELHKKHDSDIESHVNDNFSQIGLLIHDPANIDKVKELIKRLALIPTGRSLIRHMSSAYLGTPSGGNGIAQHPILQKSIDVLNALSNAVIESKFDDLVAAENDLESQPHISERPQYISLHPLLVSYESLIDPKKAEDTEEQLLQKSNLKGNLRKNISALCGSLLIEMADKKVITIKQGGNMASPLMPDQAEISTKGTGSDVAYDFDANASSDIDKQLLMLSHELIHAMHNQYGRKKADPDAEEMATIGLTPDGDSTKARTEAEYTDLEEIMKITENKIISELNLKFHKQLDLRQSHE